MHKKYVAEMFGTFVLALGVLLSVTVGGDMIPTPVIAGLVLGLFVYTIGNTSGCHINPAVTVGLLSCGKVTPRESAYYIIAQLLGGALALLAVGITVTGDTFSIGMVPESMMVFVAELVGMTVFTFGIAAVVYGKVSDVASGLVIGGSLLLGIITAAMMGSAGILNPAVALALGSLSFSYIGGMLLGSAIGMGLYKRICC